MVVLFEEKKLIKKSEDFFIMIHIMRKNMASNKETVLEICNWQSLVYLVNKRQKYGENLMHVVNK